MNPIVAIPSERDVYANLLRDTRGLRRDQALARDGWFAALPMDDKEPALFELEMLLKGMVCFGNPRNHPGPPGDARPGVHDHRDELRVLRDAMCRVTELVRALLGERDKAYTFTRFLETVLPEDTARERLLQNQLTQDTPEESLLLLRSAFEGFAELSEGLLRLEHVPNRLYTALLGAISREIGRSVFFNPLVALEFRAEFDRIRHADVLEALHEVPHEASHRVAALGLLSLFRSLRYLDLVDRYASEPESARRAYVILAVLRSDLRALARFLGHRAADSLADALERELMRVPAREIRERQRELAAQARWLRTIRSGFETAANGLRVDVRKTFRVDLVGPRGASDDALGPALRRAAGALRASIHYAIGVIFRALAPGRTAPLLALDPAARRADAERQRREIWMFLQILRAFIAKAQASGNPDDAWGSSASFQFVRDFLGHFRSIGYALVRAYDYERFEALLDAITGLRDVDLLESPRLGAAVRECHQFYEFLEALFRDVSGREELHGQAFDRRDATETLKVYLGRP